MTEATNEEKAFDTLWELLTVPSQPQSSAKATLVHETTCPYTNIAAPHRATLMPPGIPQQPNLHQPHIITQDDKSWKTLHYKNINTTCDPEPISLLT